MADAVSPLPSMKRGITLLATAFLATFSATLPASETNPFAGSRKVGFLDRATNEWVDCDTPPADGGWPGEVVARRFVRVAHDPCGWSSSVNLRELDKPATIYRSGVDVTCLLEEWTSPAPLERDSFALRLSTRGFKAVAVDADNEETIAGAVFRHQRLSGTLASTLGISKPRHRVYAWLWSKGQQAAALSCSGPVDAIDGDRPAIRALADTLRVGTVAPVKKPPPKR